ncbi:aminoglycoside phosphotransferase family protein [Nocardioides rotundus]|uniref:aminoglycoside phosphotransferase family protein n=1 Tax=Nocardioides rotundus TaxID=1774216 RepID=UPI0037C880DB|nr:aminoglycoside phosphotransferase family protein [Nocardioides rotundus]
MGWVRIPDGLEEQRGLGPDWGAWLDRLPALADELVEEWGLRRDGPALHGYTSLVVPVRDREGERVVLKVTFDGDDESAHEALALQTWGGDGAVRLIRADPRRRALLLERLGEQDLSDLWDVEACELVAGFYRRLHVPSPGRLRLLTEYVEHWADDLAALGSAVPLPRRYIDQALSLARDLVADPASTGVLIHGDLHYGNVLAAERDPWLVIDPKPMSGDPHYEPAPMLWNRMEELEAPTAVESVRDGVRRRFHTLVDVAELDEERARDWVIVRMVLNAGWAVQDARRADRELSAQERRWITRCLTLVKAVQ